MAALKPLKTADLHRDCRAAELPFKSTADLKGVQQVPGQRRAQEAIKFGITMKRYGYNLFAMSSTGSGKHRVIRRFLEKNVRQDPAPSDWIYVCNFETEYQPKAIAMPAGTAGKFRDDVRNLVEDLKEGLPSVFETDDYRAQRRKAEEGASKEEQKGFAALKKKARARGVMFVSTQSGPAFAPVGDTEEEPMEAEAYKALPDEDRERIQSVISVLQAGLEELMHNVPRWRRGMKREVQALHRKLVRDRGQVFVAEVSDRYKEVPGIVAYLAELLDDIEANAESFVPSSPRPQGNGELGDSGEDSDVFFRYRVNVLVEHERNGTAPIVYEDNPTYPNLVGRIEHFAEMGTLMTDFTLIKPGALHQANGGYLVIDARQLLPQPFAWDVLKRALRTHQIRTESLSENYSVINTVSLQPEPVPLNVKVILIGERRIYYALHRYDTDFSELFKVIVDFEEDMPWNKKNLKLFACLIANIVGEQKLLNFDRSAVARIIERAARQADHSHKLRLHAESLKELAVEANYHARQAGAKKVAAEHVDAAKEAFQDRCGRINERLRESVLDGTTMIATEGETVGQINGLSVMRIGQAKIGQPHRITARIRKGSGKIVAIEREVNLSGPIHSKGVLILSSFLSATFLPEKDMTISASLVFEQSYGGIDGDSASSTELYALLSALADIPIRQEFAVTGSVNQFGQVQAIGGVNEKIEGFFAICKERGLTGNQGVLIPKTNVQNLMLGREVVDAAKDGKFSIYPVTTIAEGIELLTGVRAGTRLKSGSFGAGTVFAAVEAKLEKLRRKPGKNGASNSGNGDDSKPSGDALRSK